LISLKFFYEIKFGNNLILKDKILPPGQQLGEKLKEGELKCTSFSLYD